MNDRPDIWHLADQIQMDLRAAQAKLVELRATLAALNITTATKRPRAGSPPELAPGACPECHVGPVNGHAADCSHLGPATAEFDRQPLRRVP